MRAARATSGEKEINMGLCPKERMIEKATNPNLRKAFEEGEVVDSSAPGVARGTFLSIW